MDIATLAFIMTDKCSASCKMCCYSCTPKGGNVLEAARVKEYIAQAKAVGTIKNISFSGGEAIMHYDLLCECVLFAAERGFSVMLVTNGFWAADYDKGYKMMERLAKAGLGQVSVSLDKYHQEFVPLETALKALRILRKLGLLSMVTVMDTKDGSCMGTLLDDLRPELYNLNMILYPLFKAGAAGENIDGSQFIRLCESKNALCPYSNDIIVLFDGSLMLCCSQYSHNIPMARLGDFYKDSLEQAIMALKHNDFFYILLKNGFSWYIKAAAELGYGFDEYCGVSCELCHSIFGNEALFEKLAPVVKQEADRLRIAKILGKSLG
jgi:TPR repeat protein